ncbi:hypothetical protein H5410_018893 [Solanum commersonii]|uniref:Uncharacterized protein n=1 Tax=Solanum commersonii TaxID=4109 RepID=A0A9J6A3C9_SOLCO|nr:hypothetical protein H5410_018893 [Solanum commersonii]
MVRSICGAARPSTIPSLRSLAFLAKAGSAVLVSIGTNIPRMVANEVKMKPNSSPQTISMIIKGITTVQRAVVNKEQQKDRKNDVKGKTYELLVEGLLLISEHTVLVSGVDLQFHWDEVEASERQPDGSLFSWFERYCCYRHIIYGIFMFAKSKITGEHRSTSTVILKSDGNEVRWEPGKPLLRTLESMGIEKEVFPVHDETKRKQLLRSWTLNWWDFTVQPIDDLCNYYGKQYIMSTIDSFLFRVSWDVHKLDALPSCIWTYGAVSGFWMNYPAGVDDESKFLEVNGISFSPPWLMDKIPRHDPLIGVQLNVNNPGCLTFKSPSSAA